LANDSFSNASKIAGIEKSLVVISK